MNKKIALTIALIMLILTLYGCVNKSNDAENEKSDVKYPSAYCLKVEIADTYLLCEQTVDFINTTETSLSELVFCSHADAYRKETMSKAYTKPPSDYGKLEMKEVLVNGNEGECNLDLKTNTLSVKLPFVLLQGDTVSVKMKYEIILSKNILRLGWNSETLNLGNFFPILAVFENGEWRKDEYSETGDPFYTECSNFSVTVVHDPDYVVAHSGEAVLSKVNESGMCEIQIEGKNMRDFAMVASKKFKYISRRENGVLIQYYYIKDNEASKTLKVGAEALSVFSKAFGNYPYSVYTMVETPFYYGGMEYPTLSYISSGVKDKESVAVHETAHQWWYGLVGSDQINESYLDEGLATFCEIYFYRLKDESEKADSLFAALNESYEKYAKGKRAADSTFDDTLLFSIRQINPSDYANLSYNRGGLLFKTIYDTVGEEAFIKSLRLYYEENLFGLADTEKLISAFEKGCDKKLQGLIKGYVG